MRLLLVLGAICLLADMAHAGELSDSLHFKDTTDLKRHGFLGTGHREVLSARTGTVDEKIPCHASGEKAGEAFQVTLRKSPGLTFAVQIQEVYPPESPGVRYTYEVYANDTLIYIRDYPAVMFGPASYFIHVDDPALLETDKINLRFVNRREGASFRLSAVWLYSDFPEYCRAAGFETSFYLAPLLRGYHDDAELEKEFRYLKLNLRPLPGTDVRLGCAQEHRYMNRDRTQSREQFECLLRLSKKYDMPLELLFVSWWGGTPMRLPDGKGGRFSDPEYQQVCWSESDNYDEGEGLRKLLGDKWDLRYGWTVPNRWSNTPWLTMNHPRLNKARHKVIGEKLGILAEVIRDAPFKDFGNYLVGLCMENEPRYWDLHCPDSNYPVKRENLWGDFNPVTVAAAAKDGVKLNPSDGLDYCERLWMHENVARYQQETYNAHARALKRLRMPFLNAEADALWHEVYSHGQNGQTFPMCQVTTYHPSLERNRLKGCRAGLQGIPVPAVTNLERAREFGRWAQVNYEENNGRGVEQHLRVLRACYAFGARFYNFYSWQSINRDDKWMHYVRDFCGDEPRALVFERPADASSSFSTPNSHAFSADVPPDWATVNEVVIAVDAPGEYVVTVYDSPDKEQVLGFRRKQIREAGPAGFDLPNSVPTDAFRRPYVTVTRSDGGDFGLLTNPDGEPVLSLYSDSRRERTQSLLICWRADAQELITELKGKHAPGLAAAEQFFRAGDYRKAYEEAVRAEARLLFDDRTSFAQP